MQTINRQRAAEFLTRETSGLIFTAYFQKKDGTMRYMNCRAHVKKGVNGSGMRYNPASYNLLPVYDMKADGWRVINLSTLVSFRIHNETFVVV